MRKIILLLGILIIGILVAGCTQSQPATSAPAPTASATTSTSVSGGQGSISLVPGTVKIPVASPITIPATGVFVYVDYIGSFSGSYGAPVNMLAVHDSGQRLYSVEAVNGTVSAGFAKLDGSSHPITVRIYKDNKMLTDGTSSNPNGMVNITANL
jgi:hypothetical protein